MKKIVWLLLGIIVIGVIVGGGWWLMSEKKKSVWDGESRIGVVLFVNKGDGHELMLMSYEPDGEAVWTYLPADMQIGVSRGYGKYSASSLWNLSEQENDRRLLTESVTLLLGVPFEWWVNIGQENLSCNDMNWECIKSGLVYGRNHLRLLTNMVWWDRMKLLWRMRDLDIGDVVNLDVTKAGRSKSEVEVDGKEVLVYLDEYTGSRLVDRRIRNEALSIRIVNTLMINGLGSAVERVIVGMGGRVVSVESIPTDIGKCLVKGNESMLKSLTAKKMMSLWNCEPSVGVVDSKANLEFWVGKNTGEWLVGKDK